MADFSNRVLRERGVQVDPKPPIHLVGPDDPPPIIEDDPETPEYKPFLCTRSKQPARLWLKPEWRTKGYSIQWYPVPVIVSDLDRESSVPQVIEIIGAGGRYRVEGFHLDELMARLNDQHVREIRAFCPRRWPGQKPGKGGAVVTHIRYEVEEAARAGGKTVAPVPVPESALSDDTEAQI